MRDGSKVVIGRIVGAGIGAAVGAKVGAGIGIAAAGTAIAGTLPLLLIGLIFGGWIGARIAKLTRRRIENDQ